MNIDPDTTMRHTICLQAEVTISAGVLVKGVGLVTAETNTQNSLFQLGVSIYRKTFKRVRFVHRGMHWLAYHVLFPAMEQARGFQTMPDDPFWFRYELLSGKHEPETTAQLKNLLQPNMTFLDIGAHVGYYSRMASDIVGKGGHVVAFEPNPHNHAMLTKNVGGRDNVMLMQVALAEEEGTAELHDYLMMSASGSLHYDEKLRDVQLAGTEQNVDFAPRLDGGFTPQTYTVRTAPVDALLAEQGISQVDVVKMDIEGAEMGALRGMRETIARSPNISLVMEFNPMGLEAFGNVPEDALQEVLAMGFTSLYAIEADGSLTDYTHQTDELRQLTQQLKQNMSVINLLLTC
ncbi:MAG: FkbM family methyltransferase [Chloroflexota bacterium]